MLQLCVKVGYERKSEKRHMVDCRHPPISCIVSLPHDALADMSCRHLRFGGMQPDPVRICRAEHEQFGRNVWRRWRGWRVWWAWRRSTPCRGPRNCLCVTIDPAAGKLWLKVSYTVTNSLIVTHLAYGEFLESQLFRHDLLQYSLDLVSINVMQVGQ